MASVISSSLRKLGLIRFTDVEDLAAEHVDADERQIALRLLGLLDQAHDALAVGSSATPNICGSGTCASRICAAGFSRWNSSTKLRDAVA